MKRKGYIFLLVLVTASVLSSCRKSSPLPNTNSSQQLSSEASEGSMTTSGAIEHTDSTQTTDETETSAHIAELYEMFGESCIPEQTFEVALSEYEEKVYFVPHQLTPYNGRLYFELIQDGEVLEKCDFYFTEDYTGSTFSLKAVSFYDVNYDTNTDIVLIMKRANKYFVNVFTGSLHQYYGDKEPTVDFIIDKELSATLTEDLTDYSISGIRDFLSCGKRNGQFEDYKEAYQAVITTSRFDRYSSDDMTYSLIYVDEDDIPELVYGINGYWVSMYTFSDGTVYNIMDCWSYGAGGNHGYEYCPEKNSIRCYDTDYAGAILYTGYWNIESHACNYLATCKLVNFDDTNGNGQPDPEEADSLGNYGVMYVNDTEATEEEYVKYNVGDYEYIQGEMGYKEILDSLR